MKQIAMLLAAASVVGCASTESLEHDVQIKTGSLAYVYDSEQVSRKDRSVAISSFTVDDLLDRSTTVKRKSTFVLPLLVFNTWKQEDDVQVGYSQIKDDYKQFLRGSLVEELNRSSTYKVTDRDADVSLDVKIKKLEMVAPINQNGLFLFPVIFWFYHNNVSEGPATVTMVADIRVSKGQAVVLTREVRGTSRSTVFSGKGAIPQYTTAILQTVALAAKDLNQNIASELRAIQRDTPSVDANSAPMVPVKRAVVPALTRPVQVSPNAADASIEEKLRTLKRAYEQELITKEEYEARKKALLDRF